MSYYATPEVCLRLDGLSILYRFLNGEGSTGMIGAEWLVTRSGLALFATGTVARPGGISVCSAFTVAGGRVYLGPSKTLADRQRQDDPPNDLIQDLFKSLPVEESCM